MPACGLLAAGTIAGSPARRVGWRMNSSKAVLAVLVSCLAGLLAACEPTGPADVKLTAPPNAVDPVVSSDDKVYRLRYTATDNAAALQYARAELEAQGLAGCGNPAAISWRPHTIERDGKRVTTSRYLEYLFRRSPARIATIEMLSNPAGTQVTVEVRQELNGEVVATHQRTRCTAGGGQSN